MAPTSSPDLAENFPSEELRRIFQTQRDAFNQRRPRSYAERMDALDALLAAILHHKTDLVEAMNDDYFHRAPQESLLMEMFPVVDEIRYMKRRLKRWMRPERVSTKWQLWPSRAFVVKQPLGVVGILGAWNYPLYLTILPLVDVLAAGNHAMIKPSELAPRTAELLRKLLAEIFPPEYVSVVLGGAEVASQFSSLPFDHILYTGSGRVGKLVMKAASANLTPVTLELGGKSPALVHESFPMSVAADRICSAKFWNAGQTCVAPDYALVPEARLNEFVDAAKAVVARRLPHLATNPDYTRMIDRAHWERMAALVEDARSKGAHIVSTGADLETYNAGDRIFPPTLLTNVNDDMKAMQEEIFGPVLPVFTYTSLDAAIEYINRHDRPLALYYFDHSHARVRYVLERTTSGGATINDCIFHLSEGNLPFGGVGASGMGAYHGLDGLDTFSHRKGVLAMHRAVGWSFARFLKPPYTKWTDRILRFLLGRP
ncbi:MAG: coniferyl aldehyde dehydrogenase [Acidobacteriaceae bacterium]